MLPPGKKPSATELAAALDGCRELHRVQAELPAGGRLTRACLRRPFAMLAVLALLPHLFGSAVKPGQVVQFTYSEAVAVSLQPHK